jgi:CBS domain-containing protein
MAHPRNAEQIMVTKLVTLSPQMHVFDGIAALLGHNITGAPVVDNDRNYLGVFSEKCCMSVLMLTAELARAGCNISRVPLAAKEFMATQMVTLTSRMDVFEAIGLLLSQRISGAPVIDEERNFLGVFSERTSMRVLTDAAYEQLPTTDVAAFMNTDFKRTITEEIDVLSVARIFLETPYRRLPVLSDGKLMGQISRRDVLRAEHHLAATLRNREQELLVRSGQIDRGAGPPEPPHGRLDSSEVATFMDTRARTVAQDADWLSLAQIFLTTNYRRLPVLRNGKLIGQISRRDLLRAIHNLIAFAPQPEKTLLYLSSLVERSEAPIR